MPAPIASLLPERGEAVSLPGRPLWLWLNLLRRIVLEADRPDEMELRFQPLDVFLALDDQVLKEFSRAGIALL